eukprot:scaffold10401_cov18-Tisochrysis_lutea.AAC.1
MLMSQWIIREEHCAQTQAEGLGLTFSENTAAAPLHHGHPSLNDLLKLQAETTQEAVRAGSEMHGLLITYHHFFYICCVIQHSSCSSICIQIRHVAVCAPAGPCYVALAVFVKKKQFCGLAMVTVRSARLNADRMQDDEEGGMGTRNVSAEIDTHSPERHPGTPI